MAMNPMALMAFVHEFMERDEEWLAVGKEFVDGIANIVKARPDVKDEIIAVIDSVMPKITAIAKPKGKIVILVNNIRESVDSLRNNNV